MSFASTCMQGGQNPCYAPVRTLEERVDIVDDATSSLCNKAAVVVSGSDERRGTFVFSSSSFSGLALSKKIRIPEES